MSKKKKESIGEYVDIDSLVEWDNNPRINDHAVSKVARSIERFGFASPIIAKQADKPPYVVLAGNTRLKASKEIGLSSVPVRFSNLSQTEAELFAIADNKLGEISDWDEDMLKDILAALPENDLDDIGFSQDELDSLLENIDTELPPESDNAVYDDYEDADNLDLERVKIAEEGGVYAIGDQYVLCGDCVEILRSFPDNSIDSIVCDPPYGIGFMGKDWDHSLPTEEWARECFRVLKHGGHIVAFGATRAIHRMVCALEDEGFEIRDMINWLYFSGFPKSMDISKQIDKMKGVEREVVGVDDDFQRRNPNNTGIGTMRENFANQKYTKSNLAGMITKPATEEAIHWSGWGTGLKPACEPAILCRKPIEKGLNVSENVLKWGTGAINIDACRFGYGDPCWVGPQEDPKGRSIGGYSDSPIYGSAKELLKNTQSHDLGRWPANIYQCAKPSRSERETGLEDLQSNPLRSNMNTHNGTAERFDGHATPVVKNFHPTVKPTKLMAWLCRLLTPKGGIVLDTFLGSGTTGVSASMEGFKFIGTEMNPEYCDIALQRIKHATGHDIMKVEGVIFEVNNVESR